MGLVGESIIPNVDRLHTVFNGISWRAAVELKLSIENVR